MDKNRRLVGKDWTIMYTPKPEWLKIKAQDKEKIDQVTALLRRLSLHTVCEEAACPNLMECFCNKTATFMILGKNCTRNCTFCNVDKNIPEYVDENEPYNIAKAVEELGLKHVVITSVTRDDLPDGGAGQFYNVIKQIRIKNPNVVIEVLIPDFQGNDDSIAHVVEAKPEIINHNVETVPSLYPEVRPQAKYERSLYVLKKVKDICPSIYTKSGIMLGLGEKKEEVEALLRDLRNISCDFVTLGQYLVPSKKHHPVVEYVHPDEFKYYEKLCYELGFKYVASGPLVRSSYYADKAMVKN